MADRVSFATGGATVIHRKKYGGVPPPAWAKAQPVRLLWHNAGLWLVVTDKGVGLAMVITLLRVVQAFPSVTLTV